MSQNLRLILFGCIVIVLPLVLMTIVRVYVKSFTNQEVGYIGIGLCIIGLGIFIVMMVNQSTRKQDRAARIRIDDLRKSNQELHYERELPLTPADISYLKVYKTAVLIAVVIAGLIVALFFSDISSIPPVWKPVAGGLVFVAILFFCGWLNVRGDKMISSGKKTIIRGIVTDKNTTIEGRTDKTKHWIYIGDHRIKVNMFTYGKYKIGDAVEFHLFERFGNLILRHEKLDGAGLNDSIES